MMQASTDPATIERSPEVESALAWLQAEQNAAESPAHTAMLLHEAAVVLEGVGDEENAERKYRAALSLAPDFREPLEHLIGLAERHSELTELGELFRQLEESSSDDGTRYRALVSRSLLQLEHTADFDAAEAMLRQAVEWNDADPTPWLLLELIGHRKSAPELREEALAARLELTAHPVFRSLLLIDLAELRAMAEDMTAACGRLDEAISLRTVHCYPALVHKTRLATRAALPSELDQALLSRIRLLDEAQAEPGLAESLGIPREELTSSSRAYLHLLRSLALAALGNRAAASVELGAARAELPDDRVLLFLNFAEAEQSRDQERFLSAGEALAPLLDGDAAAWCWTKLAVARTALHDDDGAQDCVRRGLEQAPRSLPLHALRVHAAFLRDDSLSLAAALQDVSDCFVSSDSRAAWQLAAAGVLARFEKNGPAARRALSQAATEGLPQEQHQHLGRLLSVWLSDLDSYDEATFKTLTTSTERLDRLDLGLELLRLRLTRGSPKAIDAALEQLQRSDDSAFIGHLARLTLGRWLRRTARASSDSLGQESSEADSWDYLADRCESEALAASLRCVAAVADLVSGHTEAGEARLASLAKSDPSNVVVAVARVTLALRANDAERAARILRTTAEATVDPVLRATLALYGAILVVLEETPQNDLGQLLDIASLTHPASVAVLSRWVLRTAKNKTPELERRIQSAADSLGSEIRRMLERWGMEFSITASPPALASLHSSLAPHQPPSDRDPQQCGALALLELLQENRLHTIDENRNTAQLDQALAALHAALRYAETWYRDTPQQDPSQRLVDARSWAEMDSSLLAQLEWFLVARQSGDLADEARARARIAAAVDGRESDNLSVGVQELQFILGDTFQPLLPSTSAAARFANLEMSPPGSDPRRRATALAEAADLQGPSSTLLIRANLAYNFIACGDYGRAQTTFLELVEARPNFLPAWLGLQAIAELTSDRALLARACASVGDLVTSHHLASEQWERAANLLLDELNDPQQGRRALERATRLDITRDTSFTRLFRLVREAREHEVLLELTTARLPHAKNDEERLLLLWERARVLRTLNDRKGALEALDAVTQLSPNHVGALALAGEIHIALGEFDDAARFLAQLGRHEEAPLKQRLMGAIAAADLFDKKLGRPVFARDILLELYRTGNATLPLKERLAAIAAKTQSYELAVEVLEDLLDLRETPAHRVETARLIVAICRDKLERPARAELAVDRLLDELPTESEALDLVLSACFDRRKSNAWLERAQDQFRRQLEQTPLEASLLDGLARVAKWFDDVRTREACLGALIALGCGTEAQDAEIAELDERIERIPTIAVDGAILDAIAAPDDRGPIAALFAQFAPVFAEALGPSLAALGVNKKQRVEPRAGLPLRNEIAAWAGAFGIPEFELYLTAQVEGDVIAIPAERPLVIASSALLAPLDLRGRQAVARELFALRRGTSLLRHRSVHEVAALIVAACQVGEHPLPAPPYAMKDEFVRLLVDALPRRLRKTLGEQSRAIQSEGVELADWIRAAHHSHDRVAALAAGDVSHVLAHLAGQRGRLGTSHELRERTARLIAFVVSRTFLELKDTLGLTAR